MIACVAGLSLVGHAQAEGTIKSVSAGGVNGHLEVTIQGENLSKPKESHARGNLYVLDFEAHLKGQRGKVHVDKNGVNSVDYGWFSSKPPVVRVRLHLDKGTKPVLTKTDGGWAVRFGDDAMAAPATTESFPASVPPLQTNVTVPKIGGNALISNETTSSAPRKITLKFTNTDVALVLKAIAMQADVNVVMAFDASAVSGPAPAGPGAAGIGASGNPLENSKSSAPDTGSKTNATMAVTIDLRDVSVEEALDFVSSVTNLRWDKVGSTFVVSTAAKHAEVMRALSNRFGGRNEVRVVTIRSGQGAQIKDALYRWFGPTTLEVVVPSESGGAPEASKAGPDGKKSDGGAQIGTDNYLFLIGAHDWVDQGEKLAQKLDEDIVKSVVRPSGPTSEPVAYGRETFIVRNSKADELRDAVGAAYPAIHILSSPKESVQQTLILSGPLEQLGQVIENLKMLDSGPGEAAYFVYNVAYADPRALREQVISTVPGLKVSIPPASVGNPSVYKKGAILGESQQAVKPDNQKGGAGDQNPAAQGAGSTAPTGPGSSSATTSGLAQPYKGMEEGAVPMRLVLRGAPSQIAEALRFLKEVDTAPHQVALELRVMELTKDQAINAGIDWNLLSGGAVRFLHLNNSNTTSSSNSGGIHIGGRDLSGDVTASLDKISNNNNLIARPNVMALDGRETELFVGDVVRYIKTIQASQNGTTVETGEERVGVRLSVLPRVGDNGNVTMDLQPAVSFLRGFTAVPGGGQLPQTSERTAQSTIMIHSGETIAIGGLIQDSDRRSSQGLPFLSDLPIIGQLFRRTTNDHVRTELVFFLTARVIDGALGDPNAAKLPMIKDSTIDKKGK